MISVIFSKIYFHLWKFKCSSNCQIYLSIHSRRRWRTSLLCKSRR